MAQTFKSLTELLNHGFDTVIDVRSPAEYAEDHIPGAVSMPALSNEERARVGTIYKQVSAFDAKKLGAALVARNAADAIEAHMQEKDGAWRPLVYCWRGGQRSGSFASILSQIGWRADTIAGGYQSFRRLVHSALYEEPVSNEIILLDGFTGTAKTEIIARLPQHGIQVIDLEALANHRGSLLGEMPSGQPSQKAFESGLACAFAKLDPNRPVIIEAESNKIGRLNIPPTIWAAMCAAPRIELRADIETRSAYLAKAYAEIAQDTHRLRDRLQPIRQHRGHAIVDRWEELLQSTELQNLAEALVRDHYDHAYEKSRAAHEPRYLARFEAASLCETGQTDVARDIAQYIKARQ